MIEGVFVTSGVCILLLKQSNMKFLFNKRCFPFLCLRWVSEITPLMPLICWIPESSCSIPRSFFKGILQKNDVVCIFKQCQVKSDKGSKMESLSHESIYWPSIVRPMLQLRHTPQLLLVVVLGPAGVQNRECRDVLLAQSPMFN